MFGNLFSKKKDNPHKMNPRYYLNVADLMKKALPKPTKKVPGVYDDGEFLPIITVTVGLWQW